MGPLTEEAIHDLLRKRYQSTILAARAIIKITGCAWRRSPPYDVLMREKNVGPVVGYVCNTACGARRQRTAPPT
jgi:hypothetical protein